MKRPSVKKRRHRSSKRSDENVRKHLVKDKKNGRSRRTRRVEEALKKVEDLDGLLDLLKIERWDYLFVGDGSATTWDHEAGFACMTIDRRDPAAYRWYHGGFSCGTNIVAEMMAYVLPLMHISATRKVALKQVHICTDCDYVARAGRDPTWQRKANSELWTMLRAFKRRGLVLHWHWIPRDILDMNQFCHNLANAARVNMKELGEQQLGTVEWKTIDVNGDEVTDPETPD